MRKISFIINLIIITILVNCIIQIVLSPEGKAENYTVSQNLLEIKRFNADKGKIKAIATSHDGRYTAFSTSSQVSIWDGKNFIAIFEANQVNTLLFSNDGKTLAGGGYRYIYLWDVSKGKEIRSFKAHENIVTALAFSPDGHTLASGSKGGDPVVKIWDIESQKSPRILRWDYPYSEQVLSLVYSPDGTLLASASLDQKTPVRIWNTKTLNAIPVSFQNGAVRDMAFSPDGEFLMAGLDNGVVMKIAYLRSDSGRFSILKGHTDAITGIGFTLNGNYFISGGLDGNVIYWDTSNWKSTKILKLPDAGNPLILSTDVGRLAQIGRKDATLYSLPDYSGPQISIDKTRDKTRDLNISAVSAGGVIKGIVNDESGIKQVLINGIEAQIIPPSQEDISARRIGGKWSFFSGSPEMQINENMIEVAAYDNYNNKTVEFISIETGRADYETKTKPSHDIPGFGRNYAVVIGNNDYKHLSDLETPLNDSREVEKVLREEYGFETKILANATRKDILGSLNEFRKRLTENDNLLIYYAGHGHFDEETKMAYWLPVDAEQENDTDWIKVNDITNNIMKISSKHILIVADSCYSGQMTRSVDVNLRSNESRERYLNRLFDRKSRTLIASGGNEPVADNEGNGHSVFANVFIRALRDIEDQVFTADELFIKKIKESVGGRSSQMPEYNFIQNSGHDNGDFIFTRAGMRIK